MFFFKFLILFSLIFSNLFAEEFIINDDFSSKQLKGYDKSHIAKNKKDFKSYEFINENNGNTFIRLSSRVGQLSHFNKGQEYIKDRIELGTRGQSLPNSWKKLEEQTFSWMFDTKLPENVNTTNAEHITITQLKTIEKNNEKKQCHPGMPFRINYHDRQTWIAVTDGLNIKHNKKYYYENFLTNEWINFKIEYHFSKSGWVKVFKNNELIYDYNGNTIFKEYKNCKPKTKLQTFIRIGVYRNANSKNTKPDSIDFDNYKVCKGTLKDCKLI
jgi:hypothetical protein